MNSIMKIGGFLFLFILLISSFQNCSKVESAMDSFSLAQQTKIPQYAGGSARNLSDGSLNPNFGNGSISASVLGSELTISTTARLAGSIGSLTFRGKEYINEDDHGRELQSASSYDGLGECLNPTEAGSDTDGPGAVSTSRLLAYSNEGKQLKTATQMSYWLTANQDYSSALQNGGRGCGNNANVKKAQHSTNISNDILHKQVTIGFSNLSNVIEYLVTFQVAEPHQSATFEALTGYMGRDFSSFWTYDPKVDLLKTLSSDMGEQGLPVILSTDDKNHAMGIYSPDLPQATFTAAGYGRFNFYQYNTMKWNAVYRTGQTPAGDYNFRQYVIVGTLLEVQSSMKKLHRVFYPDPVVNTPIDGGWTLWSNQGGCSQTCGGGLQSQVRSCTSPAPANGGAQCVGANSQQIQCNVQACAPPPDQNPNQIVLQNNYRFFDKVTGEHFITANYNEGSAIASFTYEGVAFKSLSLGSSAPDTVGIFRCYVSSSGKHFVSTDSSCEGQILEGSLGKIYLNQVEGSSTLHRFYQDRNGDYLTTTNYQEGLNSGYRHVGIIGYAP